MAGRGRGRQGVHTARAHACASVAREGCRRDRPRRRDWPGASLESLPLRGKTILPYSGAGCNEPRLGRSSRTRRRLPQFAENPMQDAAVAVVDDLVRGVETDPSLELDLLAALLRRCDLDLAVRGATGIHRLGEPVDVELLLAGQTEGVGTV